MSGARASRRGSAARRGSSASKGRKPAAKGRKPAAKGRARRPQPTVRRRGARAGRRRRSRRRGGRSQGRTGRGLILTVLIVGALVLVISRIDVDDTIKELTLPLRHDDIIRQEAGDEDIALLQSGEVALPEADPALLAAVIYAESRFQDQTSSAGARGLMQITPDTADTIEALSGGETFEYEDLADPDLNIRYGSFYLRYLLHQYDGNVVAALAAYNAGEGHSDEWGGASLEVEDIRFPETENYVNEVLDKQEAYRDKYAEELGL